MRFVRATSLVVSTLGLLLFTGCPPTYPKCSKDDHCKDKGEVCVQGQCQECATDKNCKAGFICDANKCVPKPECLDDKGCGPGKKCKGGKCATDVAARPPGTCVAPEDCPSGEDCVSGTCQKKADASCDFAPVRFAFNDYGLSDAARTALSSVAECIKRDKGKFSIEGHADERGTEEYNMQLSNKRAESVKKYLSALGAPGGDMDSVGFGENRPAVDGHNEESWAANRRVEFRKKK